MRIGVDVRTLGGRFTGDRTYWRGLLLGLAGVDSLNEYLLYHREPLAEGRMLSLPANFRYRLIPDRSDRMWSLSALPKAAAADGVSVAHVQYSVSPLFRMPVVTTVHDVTFRLFPELFSFKDRVLLNLTVPASIRRACRVIGVSENTRRDILTAYRGTSPEKVIATPLATGPEYSPLDDSEKSLARERLKERCGVDGPYALAVGVLQPRKNLPMLLQAFRVAKRISGFSHKLVIAGKRGWLTEELDKALDEAGEDDILLAGYISDDDLPKLYACADILCYPSLYEGFGLPPLEAMACGCPVLVSNTSSLPEVVGEAGVLLNPRRPGEWVDAIGRVLSDAAERERLRAMGIAQATRFDWKRTASATLAVYKACGEG